MSSSKIKIYLLEYVSTSIHKHLNKDSNASPRKQKIIHDHINDIAGPLRSGKKRRKKINKYAILPYFLAKVVLPEPGGPRKISIALRPIRTFSISSGMPEMKYLSR